MICLNGRFFYTMNLMMSMSMFIWMILDAITCLLNHTMPMFLP